MVRSQERDSFKDLVTLDAGEDRARARALAEARAVQSRVRQAVDAKRGDQAKLQSVWERLTTKSGPYEDQMFVDQLSNVNREISEADQKVGASAIERFNQLMKEWAALKAEAETALR